MTVIAKRCACGLAYDEDGWDALPSPSRGGEHHDAEHHEVHSYRNCPCGSTLLRIHCSRCGAETGGEAHECSDDTEADVATALAAFLLGRGAACDRAIARIGGAS